MPFKLNFSPAKDFRLPGHAVIHVTGPDSQSFLQAQCMNDVNALETGQWQYNGWLSPQGRVLALFYLIKIETAHFLLVLPALDPQKLIDGLKRYVFRSKVTFAIESSGHLLASFGAAPQPDGPCLQIGHGEGSRQLRLGSHSGNLDEDAAQRWHEIDMAIGWVWIDQAVQDLWTPHMLGLQQLKAFSVSKGCYPGQEIVARTHFLGKSKRGLFGIHGAGLQAGALLSLDGREIGRIADHSGDGTLAVAVLPADIALGTVLDGGSVIGAAVTGA
nr:folate-binding protein [Arenimonas sp. GDDSR-1]